MRPQVHVKNPCSMVWCAGGLPNEAIMQYVRFRIPMMARGASLDGPVGWQRGLALCRVEAVNGRTAQNNANFIHPSPVV